MAMQEVEFELKKGDIPVKLREFFGIKEEETPERLEARLLEAAQRKLRNLEVMKFYQIKVGRNEPCPCSSGEKFKKCCWGKINQGEFEVT